MRVFKVDTLGVMVLAVLLMFASVPVFGQKHSFSRIISGRVVQIVGHHTGQKIGHSSTDLVTDWDSDSWYMLRTNDDKLLYLDGNQNFASAAGLEVKVFGEISNGRIKVNRLAFTPRSVIAPKEFPAGQNEFYLGIRTKNDEGLVADDSLVGSLQTSPPAVITDFLVVPNATLGTRIVYAVRVKFLGDPDPPTTAEQLTTATFTGDYSVNSFYQEASYGKFGIAGAVHPVWVEIPFTDANCSVNMFEGWTTAVNTAMANTPGWINATSRVILFREIPGCELQALGSGGIRGNPNLVGYVEIQLTPNMLANNFNLYTYVLAHEIGHNLGLNHSGGVTTTGIFTDSDDKADWMASRFRYPNTYNRLTLGWFNGKLTTLSGPGSYSVSLYPLDQVQNKGTKAVVVQLRNADGTPSDQTLMLETRRNYHYDAFGPQYVSYTTGLGIRYGAVDMIPNTARPFLLDATPDSPIGFDDAALPVGQSYTDTQYGVTIEVVVRSMTTGTRILVTLAR